MEKQKRWQFYVILAVILLTLYNILPTIFFYSKPLGSPIDAPRADAVAHSIAGRVNSLEEDSVAWLESFSKLLHLKPESIELSQKDPRLIEVTLKSPQEAILFKRFLPRAGSLIPFVPAQLDLNEGDVEKDPNKVLVARQIAEHLNAQDINNYFVFTPKYDEKGVITPLYHSIVDDRAAHLALALTGPSIPAQQALAVTKNSDDQKTDEIAISLAKSIVEFDAAFGSDSPLTKRYYQSFSQINNNDAAGLPQKLLVRFEAIKSRLDKENTRLLEEQKKAEKEGLPRDTAHFLNLNLVNNQRQALEKATVILRKQMDIFKSGHKPLTSTEIQALLAESAKHINANEQQQTIDLGNRNPYVKAIVIDWNSDKINISFYNDIQALRLVEASTETNAYLKEKINQSIINDIAHASSLSDEAIRPDEDTFSISLNSLKGANSFLAFKLGEIAAQRTKQISAQLETGWNPKQGDLIRNQYPIHSYDEFVKLKPQDQKLGMVIYAPSMHNEEPPAGFRTGSIYVIAKGMDNIIQKYRDTPNAPDAKILNEDLGHLNAIMHQNGFIGYSGTSFGMAPEFSKDFIFELEDYYSNLLKATREDFNVKGSKRYAVLDFTDVEQRILTENKIDDRIQEDLLKWREAYNAAQVDINETSRYQVPAPTKNVFWQNFKLSFIKYFRGDDRKVLKWGLDLSGGKTVRIGLRDHSNRPVTNPDDLKQAVNELYTRINKMGVSERTIHIENENIVLDFPGSQNLSAADLIQASAMYFHIVNEQFSPNNSVLKDASNRFLQNIWNEAVVTNRKDLNSVNEIAWQHLGGDTLSGVETRPRSDDAKVLWDSGLRLANPKTQHPSRSFNDTLSSIAIMRGDDFSEWEGQSHPLAVVFHNFALEGSSLTNVRVGYDPSEGNNLSFSIKSSYEGNEQGDPRDDFYAWTSQFAEDKIVGTPKEAYSGGHGWRMAVILNGTIISKPSLKAALRDGATISGRFSQREINQLASDLKAGSLTYTPFILSEENVSPELGAEERTRGIVASLVALVAVVAAMIGYYRFAGVVASVAVLLNILIIWGVLQNLGAALSLPTIAGIVLTIGMAVDANVLVFERIREEFAISGRIASAIQAGYRKAFSAIVDSNITTIIAALILIQFDSGPIKGFAVSLIVGIISSMFTALFMTRYFFAGWVQNPNNKSLTMSQFIGRTHFNFIGQAKKAIVISLIIMALGSLALMAERKTILGMDFTGGYSLVVNLQEQSGHPNYRLEAISALEKTGINSTDYQVRELSRPNQLRIQLSRSLEEAGHPFHGMPEVNSSGTINYGFETNPRIVWLVNALENSQLKIQNSQLKNLDRDWTVMSGQFSDAMRNNALFGLGIALVSILIYITIRFEFKYAIAAVVGLVHDVIITLGILAFFQILGFPVQIDLQVIGAIMTIIGYSLNDTIIVFDRIREDIKVLRKLPFTEIVNHALNVTLSRTIMTSGTTLLVLLALVILGGKSIFAFSLVMTIGVLVGTFSSLFIASPVLIYFHNKEIEKEKTAHLHTRKA